MISRNVSAAMERNWIDVETSSRWWTLEVGDGPTDEFSERSVVSSGPSLHRFALSLAGGRTTACVGVTHDGVVGPASQDLLKLTGIELADGFTAELQLAVCLLPLHGSSP